MGRFIRSAHQHCSTHGSTFPVRAIRYIALRRHTLARAIRG
jgi:hypothetical protein